MGGGHAGADDCYAAGICGDMLGGLLALFYKCTLLDPIARGIAANRHFRKQNHSGAGGERTLREIDNFLYVAAEIANRRIDLSESYLHTFSLNCEAWYGQAGCKFPNMLFVSNE